ncbi:MAG: hypothetical protein HDQ91_01710 [Desulfovibrio sp.]|nr:hypothetical protein [Desulfovibrio sp.]
MKPDQDMPLEEQIKSLRREIEKLSALLAVRKMESRHPAFHKLVENIARAEAGLKDKGDELAHLGQEIANHVKHCPYRHIAGRIICMGILGYVVFLGLEWLIGESREK